MDIIIACISLIKTAKEKKNSRDARSSRKTKQNPYKRKYTERAWLSKILSLNVLAHARSSIIKARRSHIHRTIISAVEKTVRELQKKKKDSIAAGSSNRVSFACRERERDTLRPTDTLTPDGVILCTRAGLNLAQVLDDDTGVAMRSLGLFAYARLLQRGLPAESFDAAFL